LTPNLWSNFLIAQASSAAALTGLIFVAVSINLGKILEFPGVSTRAAEAIIILMGVVLNASLALVPSQSLRALGLEILIVGGLVWLVTTIRQVTFMRPVDHLWWWFAMRVVLCQLATIPFCIAGLALMFAWPGAMFWLVPGCLCSFVAGVYSAWVLLVEILR
jgi:modulator of FtsH protease